MPTTSPARQRPTLSTPATPTSYTADAPIKSSRLPEPVLVGTAGIILLALYLYVIDDLLRKEKMPSLLGLATFVPWRIAVATFCAWVGLSALYQRQYGTQNPFVLGCVATICLCFYGAPRLTALTVLASGVAAHTAAVEPFTAVTVPVRSWLASIESVGSKQFAFYVLLILFPWKPQIVGTASLATVVAFKGFLPRPWVLAFKQQLAKYRAAALGAAAGLSGLVSGIAVLMGAVTVYQLTPHFAFTVVSSVLCTLYLLGLRGDAAWDQIDGWREIRGGKTGKLTITLVWETSDDLDLWCQPPNSSKIFYSNKQAGGGYLDIDANAGEIMRIDGQIKAVENIFFENEPATGNYRITVNNFAHRTGGAIPFYVGIQINGRNADLFRGTATRNKEELHICDITIDVSKRAKVVMGAGVLKA